MREHLAAAWKALSRKDRVVLAIVVLLLLGVFVIPRVAFALDPKTEARGRFHYEVYELTRSRSFWTEADGTALPRGFPVVGTPGAWLTAHPLAERLSPNDSPNHPGKVRQSAFASSPSMPRDPWGGPWYLIVDDTVGPDQHRAVVSAGPDGKFEWGEGDDIVVEWGRGLAPNMWGLAFLAALVGLPYLSSRLGALPRPASLPAEVAFTTGIALPWMLLFSLLIVGDFPSLDTLDLGFWQLVPPRIAIAGTVAAAVWGWTFMRRLRRAEVRSAAREESP